MFGSNCFTSRFRDGCQELRSIVFLCINKDEKQVAKRQKNKGFILGMNILIHDLGKAAYVKMPSASGEKPS